MVRLPVSGIELNLRQPAGLEDILLLEAPARDTKLALALVERLAKAFDGSEVQWETLCVSDLEALLLLIRQKVFGDFIDAEVNCPVQECGKRLDVSFNISDYLAYHQPHVPDNAEPADEEGWFRLRNEQVSFRLPTVADQVAAVRQSEPERELIQRCVQPASISSRLLKQIEAAMEALAPSLSYDINGQCPECGTTVDMYFDVQPFCLRELRGQALFVYEDVHLLALYYQWSEAEILALPGDRRRHYAEMLRQMLRQQRRSA